MIKEIQEIIEKDLPKQVGETLRGVLEQGEKDAERVKELENDLYTKDLHIEALNAQISEQDGKLREYRKFDQRNIDLDNRTIELGNAERALKVQIMEIKVEEAEKRANMVMDFATGLVRNTEFKRRVFESQDQSQHTDVNGYNNWQPPLTKSVDTNETAE